MTDAGQNFDDVRERLTKAEAQLRRIKVLLIVLVGLLLVLLIPPARTLLGFGLLVSAIVFAVFLFIALVIQVLDWTSKRRNALRSPGQRKD
jgi:hypothetical protein